MFFAFTFWTCTDINECSEDTDNCQQVCVNTVGPTYMHLTHTDTYHTHTTQLAVSVMVAVPTPAQTQSLEGSAAAGVGTDSEEMARAVMVSICLRL